MFRRLNLANPGQVPIGPNAVIEDDLAFTTGESPGIQRLFDYIGSRFGLLSDTTVRNTLAKLFCEMFESIKSELAMSIFFFYLLRA